MNWIAGASGLSLSAFAFAAVMTFGAAALRGLTGFGMAIVLVPLLGMVIRPDQAVVLAVLLQFVIGPVGMKHILADAHRPSALLIAGCAVLATPLGLWLLAHTAPDVARIAIAVIAMGAFLIVILTRKAEAMPGKPVTVLAGLAAGVLTGFAAMPGPPVVPFYLRACFTPHQARASMMLVFFATAIAATVVSTLMGLATLHLALLTVLLLIPMLAGNWVGGLAFGKVSPPVWQSMVALVLGVAGVSAVLRAF